LTDVHEQVVDASFINETGFYTFIGLWEMSSKYLTQSILCIAVENAA
jgi:hypothetical protein